MHCLMGTALLIGRAHRFPAPCFERLHARRNPFCGPHHITKPWPIFTRLHISGPSPCAAQSIAQFLASSDRQAPLPLPQQVPTGSSVWDVLHFILRLLRKDRQLFLRLGLSFAFLLLAKVAGLSAPVYFKRAVDHLSQSPSQAVTPVVAALCLYGLCRAANGISKELQALVFVPLAQAAGRSVAYHTFAHALNLDITWHLHRRTGAIVRIIARGTKSVTYIFRAVVFTFLPTLLEVGVVCTLLARHYNPLLVPIVLATSLAYIAWTTYWTQLIKRRNCHRNDKRQDMTAARRERKRLDNLISAKAVDVFFNYESVMLFNNQRFEAEQYDQHLLGYQHASVWAEWVSAAMNAGQAVILAMGLTAGLLVVAAGTGSSRPITAGDLVMVQGVLLQMWAPMQFLGSLYRRLRQSIVDVEDFFEIMRTHSQLEDGHLDLPAMHLTPTSAPAVASTVSSSLVNHQVEQANATSLNPNTFGR